MYWVGRGVLALLLASPAAAEVVVDDFEARAFTDSRGLSLGYRLFVPDDYDAARSYPLVLFLHGSGNRGSDNRRQIVLGAKLWAEPRNQALEAAFVLAPQCPADDGWGRPEGMTGYGPSSPIAALVEILDALEREWSLDSSRLYVAGQSGGGWGALRLLSRQPQRFAAAILVCPAGEPAGEKAIDLVEGLGHLPLWFFHGSDDPVVPIELTHRRLEVLRAVGGRPRFSEYPEVKHDAWTRAFSEPEIVEWLYAQSRQP